MKNKSFILGLIIGAFCLTSCSQTNNEEDNTPYVYDENRVLVKDFTVKDARKCIDTFKKTYSETFGNINGSNFDLYYYLGTYNSYKLVKMNWWEYSDPNCGFPHEITIGNEQDLKLDETIEDLYFEWTKEKAGILMKPRLFVDEKCYTLTEAYFLNYVNYEDLLKIYDIWNNKRDEYKIMARFIGDDNKEDAKTWSI